MILDGKAVGSDHKNTLRKNRSTALVLDAFNAKAETILAKVNTENIGKLQAELEGAFELVNFNGMSFKNARILPEYADLYQAQLKFAAQVNELKRRDKEEQQRIKAAIREQRQTQKDLKKRALQSQNNRKRILKAIRKTEAKLSKSAHAQKPEHQARLDKLMDKLSDAKEQCQTEEAATQPTRKGYVYVISNIGSFGENVFKVGMTSHLEPLNKVKELEGASVPFEFDVHAMVYSEDAPELERYLHEKFESKRVNRVNSQKGFFNVALGEVRAEIESLDLNCQWTMKADAVEYQQSAELKKMIEIESIQHAEVLEIG